MYIYQEDISGYCDNDCKESFYKKYFKDYNENFMNITQNKIKETIYELKIEMLDDLFIQMIYQIPSFEKKNIFFNVNMEEKYLNNLYSTLDKLNLNNKSKFENIKKIYKKWFYKYLQKNEIEYIYNNIYWTNDFKKLNNIKVIKINKIIDTNVVNNLKIQFNVIKLLFFSYLKLKINIKFDDKLIILKDCKAINKPILIKINDIFFNIEFHQSYRLYIPIEDLYYDPDNTKDEEYTTPLIDFIIHNINHNSVNNNNNNNNDNPLNKRQKTNSNSPTDENLPNYIDGKNRRQKTNSNSPTDGKNMDNHENDNSKYVNINDLLKKNPIPIDYITNFTGGNPLKNVYEKYEHFNLNMKYLKYKTKYLNIKNFTIQKIDKECTIDELTNKYLKYKTKYQLKK